MSTRNVSSDPPLLSIQGLGVRLPTRHGDVRAVDGVSLTLARGRTLGLVGESGCGKSVLCRALMGLLPDGATLTPEAEIVFEGQDLAGLSESAYRHIRGRQIAMVFQDCLSSLNPVMTIGRQIAETLRVHLHMDSRTARDQAMALLDQVDVPDPKQRVDYYPHQLSGGMRQRVATAMAIACQPVLLIADEPTTALDATVQEELLNLLCRLQEQRQMTMILVTHDLSMAARRAHEIAVMYAGGIVEKAPADRFFGGMRMPYSQALTDCMPRLDAPPHSPAAVHPGAAAGPDTAHPGVCLLTSLRGCAPPSASANRRRYYRRPGIRITGSPAGIRWQKVGHESKNTDFRGRRP